ncbi:hypothetical protein [Pelagibacterium halotolerans]|uniref:hypothetical protein n=1 Tax=Pelagibacterium halotolerans TaxID=531813 RepID=UPI00384E402C
MSEHIVARLLHLLRMTAPWCYLAASSIRVIAEIMGREEESVAKITRCYVDRQTAMRTAIRQFNEAKR